MLGRILAITALAAFVFPIRTAMGQDAASLAGLWGAERSRRPDVRGELTVELDVSGWHAAIAGRRVSFRSDRGEVEFAIPEGKGSFRGSLAADSSTITGHWIQPAGLARSDPYATPLTLRAAAPGIWRGEVIPLDDQVSIYLVIRQRDDGSVTAYIRNPEFNLGVERPFRVTVDGERVSFVNANDSTGADRLEATLDPSAGRLSLWGVPLSPLDLTRRGRDDAPGFYPRTPAPGRYIYHAPTDAEDGWATATLGDVGLDTALIDSLVNRILATETTSPFSPYIHSLLIGRHGRLVLEEYFYGFDRERAHDSRSLGKTFAAALVGAAQQQGVQLGPESLVLPFFPEYGATAQPDPRKDRLALRHFMTMTTGLACDDNDLNSPGNEEVMQQQFFQKDWYRYTLDLPMAHDPGALYAYCSATVNVVGGVVERATGKWLPDFFAEGIARPLDFGPYYFQLSPTGTGYMGGGMYLRPRDMLKLGQVFLAGGEWNGRRVMSREWTEVATRTDSTVNAPNEGYHWHLYQLTSAGRTWREYEGNGNGGQMVIVLPELDLVVGFTAGNYNNGGTWRRFRDELVTQFVIPAAHR